MVSVVQRIMIRLLALVLLLGGCAGDGASVSLAPTEGPAPDATSGPRRHTVSTTVLESPEHGPQLCLGGIAESYPPQCGGPDVVGWDWAHVEQKESASGTTWGDYRLVGTWDGRKFTLTERPAPADHTDAGEPEDTFATPCDPPDGGWVVGDERTATQEAMDEAIGYAQQQAEFAGAWLDQSVNPADREDLPVDVVEERMNDPKLLVLNIRFTDKLEEHETALRDRWGGALCLSAARHTHAELLSIQDELMSAPNILSSSVDESNGIVEATVIADPQELQASSDAKYGVGVVIVSSALQAVR